MPRSRPAPLPVPADAESVLLVGGTFDPPHRGHTHLAAAARDALLPEAWLVFVPAGHSPLKPTGPVASGPHRVAMTSLATAHIPRTGVWNEEVHREGPSFWVDTLEAARAHLGPACDLRFLIGTDQLLAFPRWKDWRRIVTLAKPVVVLREPFQSPDDAIAALVVSSGWEGEPVQPWRARIIRLPLLPFSSTRIRAGLAQGLPPENLGDEGLDPVVQRFIQKSGLYRPDAHAADGFSARPS